MSHFKLMNDEGLTPNPLEASITAPWSTLPSGKLRKIAILAIYSGLIKFFLGSY